jgi:hypothetical protein
MPYHSSSPDNSWQLTSATSGASLWGLNQISACYIGFQIHPLRPLVLELYNSMIFNYWHATSAAPHLCEHCFLLVSTINSHFPQPHTILLHRLPSKAFSVSTHTVATVFIKFLWRSTLLALRCVLHDSTIAAPTISPGTVWIRVCFLVSDCSISWYTNLRSVVSVSKFHPR